MFNARGDALNSLRDLLQSLVPGIVIAVVTATVTVKLSIRQFRSERWWERKVEVYSRVLDALYHLERYSEAILRETEGAARYSDARRERMEEAYDNAIDELHKATNLGAYVISNDVAKALYDLRKRKRPDWNADPTEDVLGEATVAYSQALAKIRELAKKDLGVK